MTTEDAVKLIRGPQGRGHFGLRRKGDLLSVPLTRARIEINAVR